MPSISDARILIIATHGFERSELIVPLGKLKERGAHVEVASIDGAPITSWDKTDWGDKVEADLKISDVTADEYDALVIPGGQINPDILRTDEGALRLVRAFHNEGKVIAAICHGPWLLIEADILRGREATSYPSIRTDMQNAGAKWADLEVVASQGIVTSRAPDDLDAFVAKIVEEIEEGRHEREAA